MANILDGKLLSQTIRQELSKTLEYMDKQDKADAEEDTDAPDYDAKLEALLSVVRGELPVHIHAHRADDIATGIRIAKEFGVKLTLEHCTEGHLIPELLRQEGAAVGIRLSSANRRRVIRNRQQTQSLLQNLQRKWWRRILASSTLRLRSRRIIRGLRRRRFLSMRLKAAV